MYQLSEIIGVLNLQVHRVSREQIYARENIIYIHTYIDFGTEMINVKRKNIKYQIKITHKTK